MDKKRLGILLVFVGIVVVVTGFFMRRTETIYDAKGDIEKIVVREKASGVKVKKSDDDKVHVIYREGKGMSYSLEEKNGVITVSNEAIKFSVGLSLEDESVIIKVPENYNKEIEVTAKKKCTFDDGIKFSSKIVKDNQG